MSDAQKSPEPPIGAVLAEALGAERVELGTTARQLLAMFAQSPAIVPCVLGGVRLEWRTPDVCFQILIRGDGDIDEFAVEFFPPPDGAVRSHRDRVDGRPQDATPDASPDEAP